MTTIIESDDYREEEAALKADPIILEMADQLPPDVIAGVLDGSDAGGFMQTASHVYWERGGRQARSIGGPARALIALWRERGEG